MHNVIAGSLYGVWAIILPVVEVHVGVMVRVGCRVWGPLTLNPESKTQSPKSAAALGIEPGA